MTKQEQSDGFGIYEFVDYLNHTEILSFEVIIETFINGNLRDSFKTIEEKNRFLTAYIRYKNR